MQLWIMRHGQAEAAAASDAARRLTPEGQAQLLDIMQRVQRVQPCPDALWVSPYVRAQQTANLIEAFLPPHQRETWDGLVPEAPLLPVLARLSESGLEGVFIVSHQPLVGELVCRLSGLAPGEIHMDTGSLAWIDLPFIGWGQGELRQLWSAQVR